MPPFTDPREPVAFPGQAIRFEPDDEVRRVRSIEQLGRIGPTDYGAATAGSTATESGSSIIDLEAELEMEDHNLGQFLINPLSLVEIELRQTGQQSQRLVNKNQVGVITPYDPPNQRLVWVFESEGIQAIINNPQTYDLQKTLVYYTGFKYELSREPLTDQEIERLPGEPASVPTDTLKQRGGGR